MQKQTGLNVQMKASDGKVMPLLLVEGYIEPGEDLDYGPFADAVNQIKTSGHKRAKMRINCGGGSIISGLAMFDIARESGIEWEVQVIGIAASMGGILSQIPVKGQGARRISSNAFFMAHRAVGMVIGNAEKMKAEAEVLEKMESRAIAIYVEQTGKTEDEISTLFKGDKDNWMTAQEAKDYGFFDEVIAPENALVIKEKPTSAKVGEMVMQFQTPTSIMLKPELLAKLGLKETASQAEVEAAVEKNLSETATMKADQKEKEEKEVTDQIEALVVAGTIDAGQKDAVMQAAKANPTLAKTMLASMRAAAPATQSAPAAPPTMEAVMKHLAPQAPSRESWSFTEWQKNDMPGLMKMKAEKPDQYKALVDKSGLKITQA